MQICNSNSVGTTLSYIALLLVLVTIQMAPTNAAPDTMVSVEPRENTADVGGNFTINIELTDAQNLFGLEVTLYWDPSILQLVSADLQLGVESHPDGVLFEPLYHTNETIQEDGKYQLIATSTGRNTPAFDGNGKVVEIVFRVTDVGSCELTLDTKLANKPPFGEVSSPIAHTTVSGLFNPESPEELPIWLYITLIIAVGIAAAVAATAIYRRAKQKTRTTIC